MNMIKKFNLFINESSYSLKTEYQILHLDEKNRFIYFKNRFDYIKKYDGNLHNYEYLLLPKSLKNEYNEFCVRHYRKVDIEQYNDFPKELKINFIDKLIDKGDIDEYFDDLSDDLKKYVITTKLNSKYDKKLSPKQFKWCNDELREKYIDSSPKIGDLLIYDEQIYDLCTKKQKQKLIDIAVNNNTILNDEAFKLLSKTKKIEYFNKRLKYYTFEWFSEYQKKWFLSYKKKLNPND